MGEAQSLSAVERRLVIETLADVADGKGTVTAGISGETPSTSIGHAADAAAAGAAALMLLPPLGYSGDEREIVAFYEAVGRASGLPIMAYNNPKASGTDMSPALIARLAEIEQVVAIKECSGDARRIAELVNTTSLEVLVGGDDWALEGLVAGACRLDLRRGERRPGGLRGAARADRHRADRGGPRGLRAPAAALPAGHEAEARAVLQVGHGPRRPGRRPYAPAAAARSRDAEQVEVDAGRPRPGRARLRVIASRAFAAVDSHTEGMPTRVITGGVAPIPGATMLERKLHFERHLDELRRLLMHEPRGHGAMSGAILQPPLREDADWGVLFIEVSGCLPMCGHGTIGVATVLVETGMVEVHEPETVVRLDTPAGLVEARVRVEGGRARAVTLRNVPSFLLARDRTVRIGDRELTLRHRLRRQLLRAAARRRRRARGRSRARRRADRPRPGDHARDRRRPTGRSIRSTSASAAVAMSSSSILDARGRARSAAPPRSIPAGSTARPAAPAPRRGWRSCTRAASWRWGRSSSTSP